MAFAFRSKCQFDNNSKVNISLGPCEYFQEKPEIQAPFNSNTSMVKSNLKINKREEKEFNTLGPGSYNCSHNFLKHSFSTKNFDSNFIKDILFQQIYSNQINPINFQTKINFIKNDLHTSASASNYSKRKQKFGQHQSKTKISIIQPTCSPKRVISIPLKQSFGYNLDKNGESYLSEDPDKALKYSGNKNDSVAPNHYHCQNPLKKNNKAIDWSKINTTYKRKVSQSVALDLAINQSIKETKSKKLIKQTIQKPNLHKLFTKNKSMEDIVLENLLNDYPGPGYYLNMADKLPHKQKSNQSFGSSSERKINFTNNKNSFKIGPGDYFKDKPKIKKPKFYPFVRKDEPVFSSLLNDVAHNNSFLGPGCYEIDQKPKRPSSIFFGSLKERFDYTKESKKDQLGPGEYLNQEVWAKQNENPSQKMMKETHTVSFEKFFSPGVGSYSPEIVDSILYKIISKDNKITSIIAPFASQQKRFDLKDSFSNPYIGPGSYYKEKSFIRDNHSKKLRSSSVDEIPKFDIKGEEKTVASYLGPGTYILNKYNDWNKKSFNILFV